MGSLAENVMNGAQEAQNANPIGHSVGDALSAYKMMQDTQMARQKLDMDKQNNEIAKSQAFIGQMSSLASMPDSVQKVVMPGMIGTWKQMYPEMDPNFPKELQDPDYRAQMTQLAANGLKQLQSGGELSLEAAKRINAIPGLTADQRFQYISKALEDNAKLKAATLGAGHEKNQILYDNQTAMAVDKITKDGPLNDYTQRSQGATRILAQLDDVRSGKMVDTHQFLNDINAEYVSLLTNSKNPALGKQERTEYGTYASDLAAVLQKASKSPTSINSPEILQQIETGIHGMQHTYAKAIDQRGDVLRRSYKHNPDATQAIDDKINEVKQQFGTAAIAPISGGGNNNFEPDVLKYAQTHGITPAQAQAIKQQRTSQQAGGIR